jgi:glycosyltransferase involved in cell wall biosynthesis
MVKEKPRILFITTELPYPLNSGGRIKTFKLLEYLSKRTEVKLICAYGGSRKTAIQDFRNKVSLAGFQAFQSHKKRNIINIIKAFLFAPTLNAHRIEDSEISAMIQWSANDADIVLVDHLETFHLLPDGFKVPTIYHSHNAEFRLWEAFANTQSGFKRLLLKWEANRVKALEKWAISRSLFTFVAPNDQAAIQEVIGFKNEAFRPTLHLGNDQLLALPAIDLANNGLEIFYAGSLDWEPNRDGLMWFLQKVWPEILNKIPNCQLNICGKGADHNLLAQMRQSTGVVYHGFVDNLDDIMRRSRVAIVPLRFGSGMKIKTFDALYRGLPLVTTKVGAEGISITNKKHGIVVDEAGDFAEAVVSLLNDIELSTSMRNEGRALCEQEYTYEKLFNHMLSAIIEIDLVERKTV